MVQSRLLEARLPGNMRNSWATKIIRLIVIFGAVAVCIGAVFGPRTVVAADRRDALPKRLAGIDVEEHLNQQLPVALSFKDETGKSVSLGSYFDGHRPVIVTMNYSHCPMLCSLQLSGMVKALSDLDEPVGKSFRIVTVSFDPNDTPETMRALKARTLRHYSKRALPGGWAFLSGDDANIRDVADSLGIRYGYNEKRGEYVHPAVMVISTPSGRIARYLYGIEYIPKTLRLSLVESSQGKIGTTVERVLLYCFHYDESEGRYAPVAFNIMRIGGAIAVVALGLLLGGLWVAERKKRHVTH